MIVSAGRTAQQCLQVLGHLHIFLEKKFKLNSGAPGRQREGGKEARRKEEKKKEKEGIEGGREGGSPT